jgi:hypothetical protein
VASSRPISNWSTLFSRPTAWRTVTGPFCRTPPVLSPTPLRMESPWSTHPRTVRAAVNPLLFLADATHPLIAYPVGALGRHLVRPPLKHIVATKNVMRYLRGNVITGLVFLRSEGIRIEGYTDSSYSNCTDTRESISGVLVTVNGSPVHWSSSRLATVTHSSAAAEYIAADAGARVHLWLAQRTDSLRVPLINRSTSLTIDDKSAATYHNGVHQ